LKEPDVKQEGAKIATSKIKRGAIMTGAGVKVGRNYVNYLLRRSMGSGTRAETEKQLQGDNARDIYAGLVKLRGTALKLAQSMSLDTGVLPAEFSEVMAQAQYRVPPMNRALVRAIIKRELGGYPDKVFHEFSEDCIAAASLGQVHRAALDAYSRVAVKVQYPDVRAAIDTDLSLAYGLFRRFAQGPDLEAHFAEMRQKLIEETDYLRECKQMARFNERWVNPDIVTPQPVRGLCTQKVLTMSFVEGCHLDEFLESKPSQHERNHYGQILWELLHEQIQDQVYAIHADLHPGNFLFRNDGRLGVVDFGCVKEFPPEFIEHCRAALRAHLRGDEEEIRRAYRELGLLASQTRTPDSEADAFHFFREFVDLVLSPYRERRFAFGREDFRAKLVAYFREAMNRAEVRGSPHFIFLNRAMLGLYSMLVRLNAVVSTEKSRAILAGC